MAKITIEIFDFWRRFPGFRKHLVRVGYILLLVANLFFSAVATGPCRSQRTALLNITDDIKKEKPPQVIAEYWIGFFIRDIYLREIKDTTSVPQMIRLASFKDYENWLKENQEQLPEGTMLISGLASYVFYGAHYDGIRLKHFSEELDPRWKLVREYNVLEFLPVPEPARLWQWTGGSPVEPKSPAPFLPRVSVKTSESAQDLFKRGMKSFDTGKCREAREIFGMLLENSPKDPLAGDARYFSAICLFRNGEWKETIEEFKTLINKNPDSIWVAGAHYHIGVSLIQLGEKTEARVQFQKVIKDFSLDTALVKLAEEQLESLPKNSEKGLLGDWMDWFRR